jgi:IS1 family transposase
MYTLSQQQKVTVVSALLEGNSIRSIERMTGIHRDTIMRLLVKTGEHCAALMDQKMRGLNCPYIECDEIWTFVGKKRRNVRFDDSPEVGDQWVYVALDADTKLIPTFVVGKRSKQVTFDFINDLAKRIGNKPQITTDGFRFYVEAIEQKFGSEVNYAQLIKLFGDYGQHDSEGKYSPGAITEVISRIWQGTPDPSRISTSYVERQNLTMRMQMRRFTRLTNAFSKKLENLKAATALHFAHYNFCRIHSSLRITPAMAAGISQNIWGVENLLPA